MAEIKKNKAFYIPAFSSGALNQLLQKDTHHPISNKSFRFYQKEDEPLFHYPFILLSAHYGLRDDLTQKYGANRNECVVFGDSGGFQIASGVLEFTEDLKKKIFEWLDAQTTYAINLDLPPYVSTQKKADSLNSFERKMEISEDNFKYFAERVKQREKGTHFLNVQHGRSIQDLERWYKMAEPFADSFDGGWAIGSASFSFFTILQSILWMFKHDEFARLTERKKNTGIRQFVHVLGFSKVRYMFPVLYIQEKLNELGYDVHLTFDSSSPQTMAVRGNYIYTWTKKGFQSTRFPKSPIYDEHLIW